MVCEYRIQNLSFSEDHQISHREYFPTVMVNVNQCLPINNYLTAAHVKLDKEMDINKTNILSKKVLQDI